VQPSILLIETSTQVCSVSLAAGTQIIASRQTTQPKAHASLLAVFINDILQECGMRVGDCAAVAVSGGPGSYTGLRVGVSTAKGLCFGASIPLLQVSSLELIAQLFIDAGTSEDPWRIYPMIDARRMDVYTAPFSVFTADGTGRIARMEGPVEALSITADRFMQDLEQGPVVFTGNGASKCRDIINHPNAVFAALESHANGMARAAMKAFLEKRFEDIANYAPFYLKEFQAIRPKTDF
jgi:tRNA threonylcarbamoyladenosine biosynthesis protein TsaB